MKIGKLIGRAIGIVMVPFVIVIAEAIDKAVDIIESREEK